MSADRTMGLVSSCLVLVTWMIQGRGNNRLVRKKKGV